MPAGLGNNSCPLEVGEPVCFEEQCRQALLEQYAPVLDVTDGEIAEIEASAEAAIVAMGWAACERLSHQGQALRMIEALPIWEDACGMRPGPRDSATERRQALAAKFRGYQGNRASDIRSACAAAMGNAFVALHYAPEDETYAYWPGINPGPPGHEWMTNRNLILAQVTKAGLGDSEFRRRVNKMVGVVDEILAGDCVFDWFVTDTDGTEDGFFLDQSNLDEVGL